VIPDGYTYQRCDIYTPNEFRARMSGYYEEAVNRYISENQKPTYNTDDEIAVRHMRDERCVGRNKARHGYAGGNGGSTTKRWEYTEDSRHSH